MLGKWLKMGHGKGFRTFQEQSMQPASIPIYEICPHRISYGCVCMCVSLSPCVYLGESVDLHVNLLHTGQCVCLQVYNKQVHVALPYFFSRCFRVSGV